MKKQMARDPLLQQIKGVFVFHEEATRSGQALKLLKTLDCEILSNHDGKMLIRTHRGNLQAIKRCWQSSESSSELSQTLHQCVSQIIIGK